MARPREFDEDAVLDAAMRCFWVHGYEGTSVRHLIAATSLTGASLYNAFGDKRSLYEAALDRYIDGSVAERIRLCRSLAPFDAIHAFFADIVERSLADPDHKGCMLVNAVLEVAPHDPGFRDKVGTILETIEAFFLEHIRAGQADGTITPALAAEDLARHLLGVLIGVRTLARLRPERTLLEGVLAPALALLTPCEAVDRPDGRQDSR